jgi:hypothetical protein
VGKIGGPKVIDAVLQLARDQDEDIRRAAIEILNQTKDERAISHLIDATRDKDWWVSERSVDALAAIGNRRALPRLLEMLGTTPARSLPVVVRAIGKTVSLKIWGGSKWLRRYRTQDLIVAVPDSTKIVRRAFGEATAVALSDVKVGERIWVAGAADRSKPNVTVFNARRIRLQATWPFQIKGTITNLGADGAITLKVNRAMVAMKPYIGEEVTIQTTTETVFRTCVDAVVTQLTFADLKVDQRVVVGGTVDNTAPGDKQFVAKRVLVKN